MNVSFEVFRVFALPWGRIAVFSFASVVASVLVFVTDGPDCMLRFPLF